MSHEIRTPLNGVIGMTGVLLDSPLTVEQTEYAAIAHSSGQALLALINDILDVSKIEAGRLDLESIEFDVVGVIYETAESVALRAAEKNVELVVDIESPPAKLYYGDPNRLRQILLNLLSNAIKFTERGEIGVSLRASQHGDRIHGDRIQRLRFDVWDTGIGIQPSRIGALFEPFVQADDSTTRKFGGTGLGLTIARQLSEAMDGCVEVKSTPGVGSTFSLYVSLPHSERSHADPSSAEHAGRAVLVAVPNGCLRALIARELGATGFEVLVAATAQQALERYCERLKLGRSTAVLIDRDLSDHDANWLASAIRRLVHPDPAQAEHTAPPTLVLLRSLASGTTEDERRLFDHIITKPARPRALIQALTAPKNGGAPAVSGNEGTAGRPDIKRGLRILLADDNVVNRKVAAFILRKWGVLVHNAGNGVEALEALREFDFDMVLMDCQMPELDGYEATRQLRSGLGFYKNPNIPVVALTANALDTDRAKCIAAGMNAYLSKPIDQSRLEWILVQVSTGGSFEIGDPDLPAVA